MKQISCCHGKLLTNVVKMFIKYLSKTNKSNNYSKELQKKPKVKEF